MGDVHRNGDALVATGLGRFAYVFDTRRRTMISKVFLKQMQNAVLVASEARKGAQDSDDDDDSEGDEAAADGTEAKTEQDDVEEGFSSDDDNAKKNPPSE